MKLNNEIMENQNLNEIINKLKNEDERYASLSRRIQIIYWIVLPIYIILIIHHIVVKNPVVDIIGSTCFLFAMLIFALFFKHYYKEYKYVDYSQPTLVMLKKAAYRYNPFQLKTLWILLAVVLIDAGLSLNASPNFEFISVQVYFLGSMILATVIGLLFWRVRYKPLRDKALYLIREINGD